ncbi:MAG: PH domain-containing protein [Phycisphaerales bacterium]|nr:MAG: PH domain-containing protein [Phycisphaerales bacterium]
MDPNSTVTLEPPVGAAQVNANGDAVTGHAPEALVPAQLLDGGEIVILAIKPSLWFILINSFRTVAVLAVIVMAVLWFSPPWHWLDPRFLVQAAIGLALLRVVIASLQWVSRLYVLTNRRLMRIRGILNVDLFECRLARIQNTFMRLNWYERILRLGTIDIATAGTGLVEARWENVPRPLEVHEELRKAINAAKHSGRNGL